MIAIKLRVDEPTATRFAALHPAYGERSRVFRELLVAYLELAGKVKRVERGAIVDAVERTCSRA